MRATPFGMRFFGKDGGPIHLQNRFLDSDVGSAALGGQWEVTSQCRACGEVGHMAFECPVLRAWFAAGKVTREGHPA